MSNVATDKSNEAFKALRKQDELPACFSKLQDFETIDKVIKESSIRQKALYKAGNEGDKEIYNLAVKLNSCVEESPCESAACPVCFRSHRINVISELVKICNKRKEWRIVTLIYYFEQMDDKNVMSFDLSQLKDLLRKQLKRAGFKELVIGSFEMDYHTESNCWMPHLHLLVKHDEAAEEKLRKAMNSKKNMQSRNGVINRPILIQGLNNKVKQISYLYKSMWSRIEVFSTGTRERNTKKYRLEQEQLILSLKKLDDIGFSGLEFLYCARRYDSRLQFK